MSLVKFSDVVQRANTKEDKDNTDKIYYVGGEHIDSNNVLIKKGSSYIIADLKPTYLVM